MSQKRPRERTVEVDGIGAVTVRGWPIAETRRNTAPADAVLAAMTDTEVLKHPLTTLAIVNSVVEPFLTDADVERLPLADRRRLLGAIAAAHPETRRALREVAS